MNRRRSINRDIKKWMRRYLFIFRLFPNSLLQYIIYGLLISLIRLFNILMNSFVNLLKFIICLLYSITSLYILLTLKMMDYYIHLAEEGETSAAIQTRHNLHVWLSQDRTRLQSCSLLP